MRDINGADLIEGQLAQLLCQIVEISERGIVLRVMNSEEQLLVGAKVDEVLGGLVADSELTAFETSTLGPFPGPWRDSNGVDGSGVSGVDADGIKQCWME